jgi:hypothetical protein
MTKNIILYFTVNTLNAFQCCASSPDEIHTACFIKCTVFYITMLHLRSEVLTTVLVKIPGEDSKILGYEAITLSQKTGIYTKRSSMISGFCLDVDEICALLGYYAVSNGNPLPTFRDDVSVPSSRVTKYKKTPEQCRSHQETCSQLIQDYKILCDIKMHCKQQQKILCACYQTIYDNTPY